MEYPMRKYGRNIYENFLSFTLNLASVVNFISFILGSCFFKYLFPAHPSPGIILLGGLFFSAMLTGIAGAGTRQNRALLEPATVFLLLTGLFSLVYGTLYASGYLLSGGILGVLLVILIMGLNSLAVKHRFKPRFFSQRQFETMIQIADAMLDTDGGAALSAIEITVNVDHMLSKVSSPAATREMRTVIILVEWVLPILQLRPFPFSSLGSEERRRLIEKVIGSKGIFRNVAKAMKVLFCIGYYGDDKGMLQTGFIPFEERERAHQDQAPFFYPDPF